MSLHDKTLRLLEKRHVLRPLDLDPYGIPRKYLHTLYRRGLAERAGRGLYAWPDRPIHEHYSLVEAAVRYPRAAICLLSALRFHDLTDQAPFEVWLAFSNKAWEPGPGGTPLRIVRMSSAALSFGIETHPVAGASLRVFSPAKTVADCFKFRNKIGMDVALEALRDCLRKKRATVAQLRAAAIVDRVERIMQPYWEAMV